MPKLNNTIKQPERSEQPFMENNFNSLNFHKKGKNK